MAGPFVVGAGCVAAAAGAMLLWVAWRSPSSQKAVPRAAGWMLVLGGATALGFASGSWGIAVSSTATSAAALLILGYAAATGAPAKRILAREAPNQPLDRRRIIADLPRRIAIFLLVVPGGLIASTALALGTRSLAAHSGWAEADSTMIALAGMPLAWSIIASAQMTQSSLAIMAALVIAPTLVGALMGIAW